MRAATGGAVPDHRFRRESKAGFMCECGASLCEQRVPMSPSDYDGSLEPVLAEGHSPEDGDGKCALCGRPQRLERRRRR